MDTPIPEIFLKMISPRFHNRLSKVCALAAATLIFPSLAFAAGGNGQGDNAQGGTYSVPDGGSGIVLLTAGIGAVLLFAATQRARAKS
jgi:hypothetical protein